MLLGGAVGDRYSKRWMCAACMLMHAVGLLMLTFATGPLMLTAFAVLHGLALLMDTVKAGYAATTQPGAVAARAGGALSAAGTERANATARASGFMQDSSERLPATLRTQGGSGNRPEVMAAPPAMTRPTRYGFRQRPRKSSARR